MKTKIKLSKDDASSIYYNMYLIRKFEEKCAQLYQMGQIAGFLHLYIGQEAIATGFNHLAQPQDSSITSYRCHAHALLQGKIDPKALMAELTGRATGCSKGKGGSMHIYSKQNHFYGGNGIVGAQIPLGTGLAFAHKYKKDNGISVASMGDGGLPQGQVYEAFNLAALHKLPVIFVVENNQYSMGTPLDKTHANTELFKRGEHFGVPGKKIEAMDVVEVMEEIKDIVDYVRSGKGPYLIEANTYRFRGHSMSDPQKYRTKEEVEEMKNKKDPITLFNDYAIANKLLTEKEIEVMEDKIKALMQEVEDFSLNSPLPDESELYTDILL